MKKKSKRGGARPGAGRKPSGKAGVPVKVRVSPAASQIASERGGAWLDRVIVDADERERLLPPVPPALPDDPGRVE